MGISTTSQPRKGRHRSCAAPYGASAECQTKTTGSHPWLKFYRRYAAKMANLQGAVYDRPEFVRLARSWAVTDRPYSGVTATLCAKAPSQGGFCTINASKPVIVVQAIPVHKKSGQFQVREFHGSEREDYDRGLCTAPR